MVDDPSHSFVRNVAEVSRDFLISRGHDNLLLFVILLNPGARNLYREINIELLIL